LTRYPFVLYGKAGLWALRIGIPLACGVIGGYYSNYYRRAGNSSFGNLLSNNKYLGAKHKLIRGFDVLNRRFTEDEKEQFLFNIDLQRKGPKKYVYNPYLFATEQEYKEYYDRMNSGKAILSAKSRREIEEDNKEKLDKHEPLVYEKPNIADDISYSDKHLGIKRLQLYKKEFLI